MRILSTILSLLLTGAALAQGNNPPADKTIDAQRRQEVIEGALKKLHETYVFSRSCQTNGNRPARTNAAQRI